MKEKVPKWAGKPYNRWTPSLRGLTVMTMDELTMLLNGTPTLPPKAGARKATNILQFGVKKNLEKERLR